MIVAVGSTKEALAEAVRQALARVWPSPTPTVEVIDVRPGASTQPVSDAECIEGARNRAILAREALDAEYGVGIEAGLVHVGGLWFTAAWAVVTDRTFREGLGSTLRVPVPPSVIRRIEHGTELNDALAAELGVTDVASGMGHFGHMTGGAVSRTEGCADAVVAALTRFVHPELFD